MNNRFKKMILRAVCMLTACFSAFSFSGCSDLLTGLEDWFSSSVSSENEDSSMDERDSSNQSENDSSFSQSFVEDTSKDSSDDSSQDEESTWVSAWTSSEEEAEDSSGESLEEESSSSSVEDTSFEENTFSSEDESVVEESTFSSEDESVVEESTFSSEDESIVEESTDSSEDSRSEETDSSEEEGGTELPALDFAPSSLTEKYGYQYFATMENGEAMQSFYKLLYDEYVAFSKSTQDVEPTTVHYTGGTTATVYQISTANFGQYDLSAEEAITVWSIAMLEFPEFYWVSHKASYTSTKINVYIDEEYAEYAVRQTLENNLQAMAQECYSYISASSSQTERALAIQDYIMGNMKYAYKSDGQTAEDANWAHNIEGITLQKGVCESYAKTYDYFCGLMGVECITVTGMAGEGSEMGGHAWNIVKIDGIWYNVDVTWEDAYENPMRLYFGVPNTKFTQNHIANTPANGHGNTWLYTLPTVSETRLQPVTVSKDDGVAVTYPNLDLAFASMQDSTASYVVDLCPQTEAGKGEGITPYPYAITFTTEEIPLAKKITLRGKYVSSTVKTVVTAENAITISASLKIEYGSLEYPYGSTGTNYISTGTRGSKDYVW